jgi:hypothetical protein
LCIGLLLLLGVIAIDEIAHNSATNRTSSSTDSRSFPTTNETTHECASTCTDQGARLGFICASTKHEPGECDDD